MALLGRLGAAPWSDEFYDFANQPYFAVHRVTPPDAITWKERKDVLRPPNGEVPPTRS